jgi:hypothetical protein
LRKEAAFSGKLMHETLDQLEGLIQFQGLNFRETNVVCRHCGWSGTGGSLKVPDLTISGKKVIYACPVCAQMVAVHNGLTDREVMQEMEKIRGILAEELLSTTSQEGNTDSDGNKASIEFSEIRTQIEIAAEIKDKPEAESWATTERDGEQAPDLDFDSIRARLGKIA